VQENEELHQTLPYGSKLQTSWHTTMFASFCARDDGGEMSCVAMCGRQHTSAGCHVRFVIVVCLLLEIVW
jgi:hypothetical protein